MEWIERRQCTGEAVSGEHGDDGRPSARKEKMRGPALRPTLKLAELELGRPQIWADPPFTDDNSAVARWRSGTTGSEEGGTIGS
ncbi:hypothetical protein E2562_019527 [Oryza meyeriana var. granulata]|uniref:Uncharacterized protein n=1 Tax=Oryza meyeriana var. granulata TaxID=110450 RepID=A0A6G1CFZ4_9ORYZ|nr:hypothetical protein E2562_019527 [Oryza meyeriana var. granulata]